VDWEQLLEREEARYADGEARLDPEQLVRIGNAAYGAGLSLLMLGRTEEAREWLDRAATRWQESWEHATPTSWGRPIGAIKASLIAGSEDEAGSYSQWALGLGTETAESPIGRYAASLALLTLGRWEDAHRVALTLRDRDDFPPEVAAALVTIGAGDDAGYAEAIAAVVRSFETRDEYLEDAAVADTALALQALAAKRGLAARLEPSPVLPG
jgi:tetratricopeptide (TPR) repeat protein